MPGHPDRHLAAVSADDTLLPYAAPLPQAHPRAIRAYYNALAQYGKLGFDNEGNIRNAFEDLLKKCCSQFRWTVVPEYQMTGKDKGRISIDATLIDEFHLPRGHWKAKDSKDNLDEEIQKKLEKGYPRNNILFQEPSRAVLLTGRLKNAFARG